MKKAIDLKIGNMLISRNACGLVCNLNDRDYQKKMMLEETIICIFWFYIDHRDKNEWFTYYTPGEFDRAFKGHYEFDCY